MVRENHKKRRKENMKEIFKTKLFPLNLQLFAESGENEGGEGKGGDDKSKQNPPEHKYSDDDYLKLKGNFDKTASELAEIKKQLKAKLTDEEKKTEEEKAKQAEVENLKKELSTMRIKATLATAFSEDEIKGLTDLIITNDVEQLTAKLVEYRNAFKTKVYEDAKKEFSQSAGVPGGGGKGEENKIPTVVQNFIDQKKGQNINKAREYYFGKKE